MDNGNKRFTYLEGYKGAFFIGTIILFFYNLTGGADELMKSMSSANFLMLLLFIMYFTVTILGGLLFSIILVNDVVDGLFESKVKDNSNYKTQKTVILTVGMGLLAVWFFTHFEPRQECIKNITLSGTSVYKYENKDLKENFKSRDDALDYCMAQRWDF